MSSSIQNLCSPQNVYAPITGAVLFGTVAKAFTSINPVAAAITGALSPIGNAIERAIGIDEEITPFASYAVSHLISSALGTLAANAMGFPITFTATVLLSMSSNLILIGVAYVVIQVTARLFASEENRPQFMNDGAKILETIGHPISANTVRSLIALTSGAPLNIIPTLLHEE